jgi:hypothetical protein
MLLKSFDPTCYHSLILSILDVPYLKVHAQRKQPDEIS